MRSAVDVVAAARAETLALMDAHALSLASVMHTDSLKDGRVVAGSRGRINGIDDARDDGIDAAGQSRREEGSTTGGERDEWGGADEGVAMGGAEERRRERKEGGRPGALRLLQLCTGCLRAWVMRHWTCRARAVHVPAHDGRQSGTAVDMGTPRSNRFSQSCMFHTNDKVVCEISPVRFSLRDRIGAARRGCCLRFSAVALQRTGDGPMATTAQMQMDATRYAPRMCIMAQCMMVDTLRADAASESMQFAQELRAVLQEQERWDEWCARVSSRSPCCSNAESAMKAWLWFHRRSVGRLRMVSSTARATDDPTRTAPWSSERLHLVLCALRRSAKQKCKGTSEDWGEKIL
eukprot:7381039-Prymnesium_polylepis.1